MRAFKSGRLMLASLALVVGLTGCAAAGGSAGGGGGGGGNPNRLTADELVPVVQLDAYQAIQRLRARWLQARGGNMANVYVDGAERPGGLDALRGLPVADIERMQYMSANEATTRFGTGNAGGVIMITTKR